MPTEPRVLISACAQSRSRTCTRSGLSRAAQPLAHLGAIFKLIPDGLEPSLPGCRPGVFAAGPRDRNGVEAVEVSKWSKRIIPAISFSTSLTPSTLRPRPLFKWTHRESHPNLRFAGPVSFCWTMSPIAGVGIEPTPSWFRARRCYQQQPPRSVVSHQRLSFRKKVRGEGFEPPSPASKTGSLPLADPRSLKNALRESNPPVQLGRLAPLLLGQGHVGR